MQEAVWTFSIPHFVSEDLHCHSLSTKELCGRAFGRRSCMDFWQLYKDQADHRCGARTSGVWSTSLGPSITTSSAWFCGNERSLVILESTKRAEPSLPNAWEMSRKVWLFQRKLVHFVLFMLLWLYSLWSYVKYSALLWSISKEPTQPGPDNWLLPMGPNDCFRLVKYCLRQHANT